MSRHCQSDYICMLNWVIIIAFRLVRDEPGKYSNEKIVKLIENIHKTLVGEIFHGSGDLANRTFLSDDIDPLWYSKKVKELMMNKIFDDFALRDIVSGIKEELQKLPEPQIGMMTEVTNTDVKSQKITPNSKIRKTTVDLGRSKRDKRGGNITRKHHHDRVEETTKHTRKHKIYTLFLNKTRRNK